MRTPTSQSSCRRSRNTPNSNDGSERWKQVDDILQSVTDRGPEERGEFLRQACAGDETLEREVRFLLASDKQSRKFLENPALEVAARAIA
jgi:hypothetical protein